MNKYLSETVLVAILSLLLSNGAAAQMEPAVPVRLSQAIDQAIKGRPELHLALEKKKIAQSKVKEAKGNFLPTLDLSASSSYTNNFDTFTGIDISAKIADEDVLVNIQNEVPAYELSGGLDFSYNLYAGGLDSALVGEARYNLEAAKHQEALTLRKIRLEVANAYWGLKKAQVKYLMAKRALEVARLEMQVAQKEHRVDRASDVAYETVLLKGREKEVALRSADRDCLEAFIGYLHVLGLPEEVMATSCQQLPALLDEPDGQTVPDEAPPAHPEILRLKSDLQAASERKKAAKAERLPKLDLFAKYALIGRDSDAYLDSWRDAESAYYMVGLKVSMNLFNGFRTQERIRQREGEQRVKRLELMEKERELEEERRIRQTALETAQDQLELSLVRKKLERARQQAAAAELRSGRISRLEYRQKVVDAKNAADEATIARIDEAVARNALALMVLE